jgi:3-dehydroquinate synthase
MKTLKVNLGPRSYDIYIERNILRNTGAIVAGSFKGKKIGLITDGNVNSFYGDMVCDSLVMAGFEVHRIVLPAGEKTKSFENLIVIYSELLKFQISRTDRIIALGGGVIGDLTGFAASTLLRGIPYIQIPTSLLAQVDSSVGGKVAVDLPAGKNLVGSFYQPNMVIIDPDCLKTLPHKFLCDGTAEVIKYGCIRDNALFERLISFENENEYIDNIDDIIFTCCDIKRAIVENDENDRGERMLLNFGHTFGHAVESYFGYEAYPHGEAVAIGMCVITKAAERLGLTQVGCYDAVRAAVLKYGLPCEVDIENMDWIVYKMLVDKKAGGENISLILLKSIGESFINKIGKAELTEFFKGSGSGSSAGSGSSTGSGSGGAVI